MGIYAAITKESYETIEQRYVGQGYGTFKKDVAELLVDTLRPIHERYNDLIDSPELDRILDEGAVKAREKASKTYRDVELAMGFIVNNYLYLGEPWADAGGGNMEVREVTERFPCGEVEETFADYILVSWVMWLFFGAVATWAVWHSQRGVVWNHIAIDYIIVGFCVWRMTRQRRPLVYVCEKGIVIRRRPSSLWERIDMLWNGDHYYNFIPYAQIIGFTANWEEIHMVTESGVSLS